MDLVICRRSQGTYAEFGRQEPVSCFCEWACHNSLKPAEEPSNVDIKLKEFPEQSSGAVVDAGDVCPYTGDRVWHLPKENTGWRIPLPSFRASACEVGSPSVNHGLWIERHAMERRTGGTLGVSSGLGGSLKWPQTFVSLCLRLPGTAFTLASPHAAPFLLNVTSSSCSLIRRSPVQMSGVRFCGLQIRIWTDTRIWF